MKWSWIGKRWLPRSSSELRRNTIYKWTNRIVWLLIGFFGIQALVLALLLAGVEGS